jgi:hypothetical protein
MTTAEGREMMPFEKLNALAKGNHEPSPFITPFEAYLGGPQIANRVIK